MLTLPNVTLIALGSTNIEGMAKALEYSSKEIKWGAVKLITEVPCPTIDEWNRAIIFDLWRYVDTEFCMLIHPDGYVVNPESWNDQFLDYDFIGAPWPLPTDHYSYRTPDGEIVRVGNSVSIRSRRLLEIPYKEEWLWLEKAQKRKWGNTNEDGFICCHSRRLLQHLGCRFAPIEVAKWFSRELDIPENQDVDKPFAFHRTWGRNSIYKDFEYND